MNILKRFKKLFDPIDLTKGSIWKDILTFTSPIMLSTLLQKIYSLIDTIICGQTLRFRKEDLRLTWKDSFEHLKNGLPLGLNFSILSIGTIIMSGAVISFDRMPDGSMNPSPNIR